GLAVWSAPSWLPDIAYGHVLSVVLILIPLATVCVLVRRFVTGSPPRRRALVIGGPIALLFLLMQASYRALFLVSPNLSPSEQPVHSAIQWTFAGARAFIWYGFLFALIAAELFASRVLRDVVRRSLERPSLRDLESMLARPLGDPGLRLGFWRPGSRDWVGHD